MARVEIRTDEGSHPLPLEIANLTLRELLLIRSYGDRSFARAFRYDAEDIARARRNERLSATMGMRAEIEDPLSGKPMGMRDFLRRTLQEVAPLAEALGYLPLLAPLQDMAEGASNTADRLRSELQHELGGSEVVPVDVLRKLAERREQEVASDIEQIGRLLPNLGEEAQRLRDLWDHAREEAQREPGTPIRFGPSPGSLIQVSYPDKAAEVLDLAQQLIRIESVSCAPPEGVRLDEIRRAATWVFDYLQGAGLDVRTFEKGDYPAILASFPGREFAPIMLSGHFDVVEAERAPAQFQPRIEGDYLWGRGACDMKTVLATFLVWMKDTRRGGAPYPGINALLIGNEEIGEIEPQGTPHVLAELWRDRHYAPGLVIAGERTGERGDELLGEVCIEGRGLVRLTLTARGTRGHTGIRGSSVDLSDRLLRAQEEVNRLLALRSPASQQGSWRSQVHFPFVHVGQPGVFNVSASSGTLGVEIRPVPDDRFEEWMPEIERFCQEQNLELEVVAAENGTSCAPTNSYLSLLLKAISSATGSTPVLGRKLPATSARFAPHGQVIVWGQAGVGPHAADERHFIPSIHPYYCSLVALGEGMRLPPASPSSASQTKE
jgi:succinyl-diaminopimelate desuccinylase